MPDHFDPIQAIWTSQKEEPFTMSLADIHARADKFQNTIRNRNLREWLAAAFVIAVFTYVAIVVDVWTVQVGAALIILASLYVSWQLHEVGRAAPKQDISAMDCAAFHRAELVRQRDALRTVWRWYLLPFAPGMVVFTLAVSMAPESGTPLAPRLITGLTSLTLISLLFWGIWALNAAAAKKLDEEIKLLDSSLS
jgi:hypothetical protein